MTQARLGWGALIQYWDGAAYVTVAEAQSISGPSLTADDIDVTNHDSSGGFKEYISGLKEGGNVTFNGNLVPEDATHQVIIDDQKSGLRRDWRIVAPTAELIANRETITFVGYVQSCNFEFPTESQMTYSLTLKIAGEPTISSVWSEDLTTPFFVVNGYTDLDGNTAESTPDIHPAAAGNVYTYGVLVANSVLSCRITPTCTDCISGAGATTIYINHYDSDGAPVIALPGEQVDTTDASSAIPVAVGVNHLSITTDTEDQKPRKYSITVVRAAP